MKYLIVTTTDLTESFVFAYLSPQDCQERKPFGMINGGDERIGSFYRLNVETVCCCIQATLDNNELNKAAETLLQVCDQQTEIIILTSRHKRNLVDSVEYDMESFLGSYRNRDEFVEESLHGLGGREASTVDTTKWRRRSS